MWRSLLLRLWASFSFVGLATGTVFFAASLSPSLLPRTYIVQGMLSGLALAVGYGVGVAAISLWRFLELPVLNKSVERAGKYLASAGVAITVSMSLWRATVWQNSIRELMEMPPVESVYASSVAAIAIVFAVVLVALGRGIRFSCAMVDRPLKRFLPRRVSYALSVLVVGFLLLTITNKIIIRQVLVAADAVFLELDGLIDDGIEQPTDNRASGGTESLIEWKSIGRRGRDFITTGPNVMDLADFSKREAKWPVRVYVGLGCGETADERASLALEELKRVGGFDREVLVVANPTGTGWLDPGAVDTLEYLHAGDTAIVSMQYSYLPSWISILVDPDGSRDAAHVLFEKIYGHWKTLPRSDRPRLYLHGLSLGALGSETCADLFTLFEDPIDGAVWSGPPFPSTEWASFTKRRNPDSPAWLPTFRDGRMVRFTGRKNTLDQAGDQWGPMRFVYIQHASDPMTFFSPDLLLRKPNWVEGQRGPDVSPYLDWYPIVTFMQIAFDLPMATSVPKGYGHNIAPASYIDAWKEVTVPANWTDEDTMRLKQRFEAN